MMKFHLKVQPKNDFDFAFSKKRKALATFESLASGGEPINLKIKLPHILLSQKLFSKSSEL